MHKLTDNVSSVVLLTAKRRGNEAATTYTGDTIDLAGEGRKLSAYLVIGTNGVVTTTISVVIQQSETTGVWATLGSFAPTDLVGDEVIDLTPTSRYIRAVATLSATSTVTIDCAVLGAVYNERYRPSNVA